MSTRPAVYQLVKTGLCYLLNRPLQVGKSLLVSTLELILKVKKNCSPDWR